MLGSIKLEGFCMEFFRKHQKIIVSILALSFIFWTIAPLAIALIAQFGN